MDGIGLAKSILLVSARKAYHKSELSETPWPPWCSASIGYATYKAFKSYDRYYTSADKVDLKERRKTVEHPSNSQENQYNGQTCMAVYQESYSEFNLI